MHQQVNNAAHILICIIIIIIIIIIIRQQVLYCVNSTYEKEFSVVERPAAGECWPWYPFFVPELFFHAAVFAINWKRWISVVTLTVPYS